MHNEIFSDGCGEITVSGSVVRIDLVSLSPTERDAAGNPKSVFRQRIIMPVDAFANTAELMQKALSGLLEAGAITRTATAVASAALPPIERPAPDRANGTANVSPNFN